jgi:hypothetical protein
MTMMAIRSSDDRKRQQKGLERSRDRASQHGADADREADIRGRRYRPAAQGLGTAPVQGHIDGGRHHEAPDRRDHRQSRLAQACEHARAGLALDLETDEQEEDRHQAVIDPMLERLGETDRSDPDLAGQMQERGVARLEGRIGDQQGRERRQGEPQTPVQIGSVARMRCGFSCHVKAKARFSLESDNRARPSPGRA